MLVPLVGGQLFLHAAMAGLRLGAPLWALQSGHAPWVAGLLMALFAAAPILLALRAGRMADRHGYHRPVRLAVVLVVAGCSVAALGALLDSGVGWAIAPIALGATLAGAGANFGLIAIQRSAGRMARDPTELKQVFSWLGLAPAMSNMLGPVLAGLLIDAAGFGVAFGVLALLPLATAWWARRVPAEAAAPSGASPKRGAAWDLLAAPAMRRLLLVNWLVSSSWDVHSFAVPVLGHSLGFSASAIGLILGVFATAVAGVRLVIPWLAHRLHEGTVLSGTMVLTALAFGLYPLLGNAWAMGACAAMLGIALGAVQPMIMSTLHQITPEPRQGEAIALRSMTINFSSTVMPLAFGLVGSALGVAALFWAMGAMVGAGAWPARRLGSTGA
ncbi:MFS transporter [Rivibacter subsaxonicus]|uniref:Putative MFS family arabinose efflux permease n=1 Tax=Rivibacter subsaxonicus TaxID=457575 RepID=A0A4V6MEH3_9BURK|nr:MFS transporter [Rivibacter subsaxonicus]RZT93749.1 putative MFS family arabinose efflux permease [Rivibacter subsaxonicus]